MFDVQAESDVTVTSLSFHTPTTEEFRVVVYTKQGSFDQSERDPHLWTEIANVTVQGQGSSNPTPIPSSAFDPVQINTGTIQAFYVTTVDSKNIYMTGGGSINLNGVLTENADLSILAGFAVTDLFGSTFSPFGWNGEFHYSLSSTCADTDQQVLISNVGAKSCEWVSHNSDRFGSVCNLIDVATACPATCGFCATPGN